MCRELARRGHSASWPRMPIGAHWAEWLASVMYAHRREFIAEIEPAVLAPSSNWRNSRLPCPSSDVRDRRRCFVPAFHVALRFGVDWARYEGAAGLRNEVVDPINRPKAGLPSPNNWHSGLGTELVAAGNVKVALTRNEWAIAILFAAAVQESSIS